MIHLWPCNSQGYIKIIHLWPNNSQGHQNDCNGQGDQNDINNAIFKKKNKKTVIPGKNESKKTMDDLHCPPQSWDTF